MKKFTTTEVIDLLNQVYHEEISFSRMVEILNDMVSEAEKPIRKFKVGDKVRIKNGVSSKTHIGEYPCFAREMDDLIGKTMTVGTYTDVGGYVVCNEHERWLFHKDWLEPYVEDLKEGDLAIFWDEDPRKAFIHLFSKFITHSDLLPYIDGTLTRWKNAVKLESKEQFEKLIKGEI